MTELHNAEGKSIIHIVEAALQDQAARAVDALNAKYCKNLRGMADDINRQGARAERTDVQGTVDDWIDQMWADYDRKMDERRRLASNEVKAAERIQEASRLAVGNDWQVLQPPATAGWMPSDSSPLGKGRTAPRGVRVHDMQRRLTDAPPLKNEHRGKPSETKPALAGLFVVANPDARIVWGIRD